MQEVNIELAQFPSAFSTETNRSGLIGKEDRPKPHLRHPYLTAGVAVLLVLVSGVAVAEMVKQETLEMEFPNDLSREKWQRLGPYDGGNQSQKLFWKEMHVFESGNN